MNPSKGGGHRRDIDGLRALAVLPVVFYHFDIAGFSGGFVGVDVFFVISGYLITGFLTSELSAGSFSISGFYERRIRRLLPAFLLVACFCWLASWRYLLAEQFSQFSLSLAAASVFSSNIFFWRDTGYFSPTALSRPLLHTWSLGVEEQFYIAFPLLLLAASKIRRVPLTLWLILLFAVSLLACVLVTNSRPASAFYLPMFRAWELALGALLTRPSARTEAPRAAREMVAIMGLALILWSVITFGPETPFPGAAALAPTIGAAMLIWAGSFTSMSPLINRALSARPFVFVGLISYSIYLWHWPLLVFAHAAKVTDLTSLDTAILLAVTFAVSAGSWRWVEIPFRNRRWLSRGMVLIGAIGILAPIAFLGWLGNQSGGWPNRLPPGIDKIISYAGNGSVRSGECFSYPGRQISPIASCIYGAQTDPTYAVWGDSHADAMIDAIADVAGANGRSVRLLANSGCMPMLGVSRGGDYHACGDYDDAVVTFLLSSPHISTVILIARWSVYIKGYTSDLGPAERGIVEGTYFSNREGSPLSLPDREATFQKEMPRTVGKLVAAGKRVIIVYPIPEAGYDVPTSLVRALVSGISPHALDSPRSYYDQRQRLVSSTFDKMLAKGSVEAVNPSEVLCDSVWCRVSEDGLPLYRDDDHPSSIGAHLIAARLAALLSAQ